MKRCPPRGRLFRTLSAVVALSASLVTFGATASATDGGVSSSVSLTIQYAPTGANSLFPGTASSSATVNVAVEGSAAGGSPTGTITLHVPTSSLAPAGTLSDCDAVTLSAGPGDTATGSCVLDIHDFCASVMTNPQSVRAGQATEDECCPTVAESTSKDPAYGGDQCTGSSNQTVDGTAAYIQNYGEQSITVSYSGDRTYAGSTSPASTLNVSPISCVDSLVATSSAPGCSNLNGPVSSGLEGTTLSSGAPLGLPPPGTPDESGVPHPDPLQSGVDPAIVLLPTSGSGSSVYDVIVPSGSDISEYLVTENASGDMTCLDSCQETVFNGTGGEPSIAGGSPAVSVATIGASQYYVLATSASHAVSGGSTRCTQLSFAPVPASTTNAASPLAFSPDTSDFLCDYQLTSDGVPNGTAMDPALISTDGGGAGWWLVFSDQPTGNESIDAQAIEFLTPTKTDPTPAWSVNGTTPIGTDNVFSRAQVLVREGTPTETSTVEYEVETQPIAGVPWQTDAGNNKRSLENPAMIQIDPAGAAPSAHCDVTDSKNNGTDACYMLTFSYGAYGPLFGPGGEINYCPDAGNWCSYPWNYNTLQVPCLFEAKSSLWHCSDAQMSLLVGSAGGLSFSPVASVSNTEATPAFTTEFSGQSVLAIWATWTYKDLTAANKLVRQAFVGRFTATSQGG